VKSYENEKPNYLVQYGCQWTPLFLLLTSKEKREYFSIWLWNLNKLKRLKNNMTESNSPLGLVLVYSSLFFTCVFYCIYQFRYTICIKWSQACDKIWLLLRAFEWRLSTWVVVLFLPINPLFYYTITLSVRGDYHSYICIIRKKISLHLIHINNSVSDWWDR
jgi:hypothetical protein